MKLKTRGMKVFQIFNITLMLCIVLVCVYPFIYVIFASFSDPWQLISHSGPLSAPLGFSLESYKAVFGNRQILTGYMNTIFNLLAGTTLNILLTLLGAYAISRKDFLFRRPITFLILFTMFFTAGIIPRFLVVRNLGLYDSRLAMIVPTAINVFNLIIMRTAMEGMSDSLLEAAVLEGANDMQILFKIVCPLIMSTIAVLILYYGVSHWNQWYQALMYIQDREKFPLQLILREILIGNSYESMATGVESAGQGEPIGVTIKYATIIVSTVPILFIYPFLQKYFVKGVMVGAVKG